MLIIRCWCTKLLYFTTNNNVSETLHYCSYIFVVHLFLSYHPNPCHCLVTSVLQLKAKSLFLFCIIYSPVFVSVYVMGKWDLFSLLLISLNMMSSNLSQVAASCKISYVLGTVYSLAMNILNCGHILAIVQSASVNIGVHIIFLNLCFCALRNR